MSHSLVPSNARPTRPRGRTFGLADAVLDLLLPDHCLGCACPHTQLCSTCRAQFEEAQPSRARPTHAPPGLPEVYAAARYEGPVRQTLLAHKERGALGLARPLGLALARAVGAAVPVGAASRDTPLLLVPMPSTRAATRARGHDPTRRLTRHAASALRARGVPARALPALRHRRRVADQAGLSATARHENLRGALCSAPRWERALALGRVVLVDDLVTTGASLAEGARALGAAGADVLAAAVVAATPDRPASQPAPVSRDRSAASPPR